MPVPPDKLMFAKVFKAFAASGSVVLLLTTTGQLWPVVRGFAYFGALVMSAEMTALAYTWAVPAIILAAIAAKMMFPPLRGVARTVVVTTTTAAVSGAVILWLNASWVAAMAFAIMAIATIWFIRADGAKALSREEDRF